LNKAIAADHAIQSMQLSQQAHHFLDGFCELLTERGMANDKDDGLDKSAHEQLRECLNRAHQKFSFFVAKGKPNIKPVDHMLLLKHK
jgi:hypothetical protein